MIQSAFSFFGVTHLSTVVYYHIGKCVSTASFLHDGLFFLRKTVNPEDESSNLSDCSLAVTVHRSDINAFFGSDLELIFAFISDVQVINRPVAAAYVPA